MRWVAATTICAACVALSGCLGPVEGTDAMVDTSERVLAVAEDVIPQIADELDLEIVEAESTPYTNPGSEGSPQSFVFEVDGEFGGELPSQRRLEDAMTSAGLIELVSETPTIVGSDDSPWAVAHDANEDITVEILLRDGAFNDGFRFVVQSSDDMFVSDDAVDEYFPDLIPAFDQSLVTPSGTPAA